MAELLKHPQGPPDAVFCYNDLVALGAIRTLLTNGVRIPQDIAVVGFDDIEAGRYNTPTLTTIAPDKTKIAELAVDRLIARLDQQDDTAPEELWAPYELMVRESTVAPGASRLGEVLGRDRRPPTADDPRVIGGGSASAESCPGRLVPAAQTPACGSGLGVGGAVGLWVLKP